MKTATLDEPRQTLLRAEDRGRTNFKWLDSQHSFSFGEYYDADRMSFRALRVINDDKVAPGMGFPTHPHRDMEILTYVISGQLQHRDSMGNGSVIKAGELQAMTAGRGITHSEFNPSRTEAVHLLQIWITPESRGLTPSYGEWKPGATAAGPLTLLASREAAEGSGKINQDARLYLGQLTAGEAATHQTDESRGLWVQLVSGELTAGGEVLHPGDALAVEGKDSLAFTARSDAQFLLFDLV